MPFTTQKLQKWATQKQMTEELQKRSTAFHKAVLPTFTKQLRKNYTIMCFSQAQCKYIHKKITKQN